MSRKIDEQYVLFPKNPSYRGRWLGKPVNFKEANKQAEIYVGRSLTLHVYCFMLTEYQHDFILVVLL